MRSSSLRALSIHALFTFVICVTFVPATCLAQTYISFDAPGAGTGPDQGTFPTAITRNGFIGVTVKDNNSFSHGFVRLANGKFTKVQPPHSIDTYIAGVNWRGQVAGSFFDKVGGISHGYVKNANGTHVQLDVPDATGG